MSENHECTQCPRTVEDHHRLCKVCRESSTDTSDGNDDDPPGPGVATTVSPGPTLNLAPTAEPSHRVEPQEVAA